MQPNVGLEARIGVEITDTMAILEWMIPRAADATNRFLVGDDGRTAFLQNTTQELPWQGV